MAFNTQHVAIVGQYVVMYQPEKVTISGTAVILFHAEWAIEL
jgi:hypothetical protein